MTFPRLQLSWEATKMLSPKCVLRTQLSEAINCFSKENKHGEAGYGRVYK
nr:hypothetical protein [Tanacetum cinerariifolium]